MLKNSVYLSVVLFLIYSDMAKVCMAENGTVQWGPVKEAVLKDPEKRVAELLDLETGKRAVFDQFGADDLQTTQWVRSQGMDVLGAASGEKRAVLVFDLAIKQIPGSEFETIDAAEFVGGGQSGKFALEQSDPPAIRPIPLEDKDDGQPAYLFRTREGIKGIFQLLGPGEEPKSVKFRYKLAQNAGKDNFPSTGEKKDTLLYVRTVPPGANVYLDDEKLGTSDGVFHVAPGVGSIRVEREGYKPGAKQIRIRADGVTRVALELRPEGAPSIGEEENGEEENVVTEGIGWKDFRVGMTEKEMIEKNGPFEPARGPNDQRKGWMKKHHIDCFFGRDGQAVEVQFAPGFKLPLASGVKIGSPEKEVLAAYGVPDHVRKEAEDKVVSYNNPGVLLWIWNGRVTSFSVYQIIKNAHTTPAKDLAEQLAREGWELWGQQRYKEAQTKFSDARDLDALNTNAWNGLGWSAFNLFDVDTSDLAFRRALKIQPDHPAALNGLGQLNLAQKKYEEAEKYLLQAAPTAPAAWYGLARLYLLQGKWEQAEKYAQMIVDSGQADKTAEKMLEAAKEKRLGDELRMMIMPQPGILRHGS